MTDALNALFSAWGDTDPKSRAATLGSALATDFYYADPQVPAPITNLDDLAGYLAGFTEHMPGASAQVAGAPSSHNGHVRVFVDFMKDDARMMRGQYFADLDDAGKITRLVGFAGTGEEA
ncbi:MAG: nuclear transport factor 2 family protein [Paracoccaceae bacterium]